MSSDIGTVLALQANLNDAYKALEQWQASAQAWQQEAEELQAIVDSQHQELEALRWQLAIKGAGDEALRAGIVALQEEINSCPEQCHHRLLGGENGQRQIDEIYNCAHDDALRQMGIENPEAYRG